MKLGSLKVDVLMSVMLIQIVMITGATKNTSTSTAAGSKNSSAVDEARSRRASDACAAADSRRMVDSAMVGSPEMRTKNKEQRTIALRLFFVLCSLYLLDHDLVTQFGLQFVGRCGHSLLRRHLAVLGSRHHPEDDFVVRPEVWVVRQEPGVVEHVGGSLQQLVGLVVGLIELGLEDGQVRAAERVQIVQLRCRRRSDRREGILLLLLARGALRANHIDQRVRECHARLAFHASRLQRPADEAVQVILATLVLDVVLSPVGKVPHAAVPEQYVAAGDSLVT